MGADLYIRILYEDQKNKYRPEFDKYVKLRNKAKDEKENKKYQKKVDYYYNKMYEKGYYRDSYNDSNLLWKLNLDYWIWFKKFLNKEGELTPAKAKEVLQEITKKERRNLLSENLKKFSKKEQKYFIESYQELQDFLKQAIKLKANIDCSI